ncbi:kin of IRRE-like protein 1 [Ptychodera flava]|uniref:kin of IRRE-like protein 1 n=1 Tax=Ptychodera flava TaxID=63121 RepID=UPI00396AADB8
MVAVLSLTVIFLVSQGTLFGVTEVECVSWIRTPNDTVVLEGTTVTLHCTLDGIEPDTGWPKWSQTFPIDRAVSAGTIVNKDVCSNCMVSGNHSIGEYNLQIQDVQLNPDEGQWECRAFGVSPSSYTAELIIFDEDLAYLVCNVSPIGPNRTIASGDLTNLTCDSGKAAPPGELVWTINGSDTETKGHRPLIWSKYFQKSESSDVYSCKYTYPSLEVPLTCSDDMTFDIQYHPSSVEILYDDEGKVKEHETFSATCHAEANPTPNYRWFSPTGILLSTKSLLIINSTQRSQAGTYRCDAKNKFYDNREGNASAAMISMCNVTGKKGEQCKVRQEKDEEKPIRKKYIYIRARIYHLVLSFLLDSPTITTLENVTTVEGDTVQLECNAEANPRALIYWTLPDATEYHEAELILEDIKRTHAGFYTCSAINILFDGQLGKDERTINVDVQFAPTQIGEPDFAAGIGESVILTIEVEANPLPVSFSEWRLGDLTFTNTTNTQTSSSLFIRSTTQDHFGVYVVHGVNSIGTGRFQVALLQKEVPEPPQLEASGKTHNRLLIKIIPGFDGRDPENIYFLVEYGSKGDDFLVWTGSGSNDLLADIQDLDESTTYEVRGYAINSVGTSDKSDLYEIDTMKKPEVFYFESNNTLTWTNYGKGSLTENCVKIEMSIESEWLVLEECYSSDSNCYEVETEVDNDVMFRIAFCLEVNICDSEYHKAVVYIPSTGGTNISLLGLIFGLLGVGIVVLIIFGVWWNKRRKGKPKDNDASVNDIPQHQNNENYSQHPYEDIDTQISVSEDNGNTEQDKAGSVRASPGTENEYISMEGSDGDKIEYMKMKGGKSDKGEVVNVDQVEDIKSSSSSLNATNNTDESISPL